MSARQMNDEDRAKFYEAMSPLKDLIVTGDEAKRMRDVFVAMIKLKRAGWGVAVGDGPGLTYVGGRQLTTDQLLDLASRIK